MRRRQNNQAESELIKLKDELKNYLQKSEILSKEITQTKAELKSQTENLNIQITDKDNQLLAQKTEIEILKKQVLDLDSSEKDELIESLKITNQKEMEKLTQIEKENSQTKSQIQKLEEENSTLKQEKEDLDENFKILEDKYTEKENKYTEISVENDSLKTQSLKYLKKGIFQAIAFKIKDKITIKQEEEIQDLKKGNTEKAEELSCQGREIEHLKEKIKIHEEYRTENELTFKALR